MNIFSFLYTELLWRPIFNGLVFFYAVLPWHDPALAIIALTIALRILLLPLHHKAQKSQKDLARIQPEMQRIRELHKNDREAQGKALMEVYTKHSVNPFSGCLVTLLQIPVLIAVFAVFRASFQSGADLSYLYSFIPHPDLLNSITFFGIDLAKGNLWFGVPAAITQYFQAKLTLPPPPVGSVGQKKDFAAIMQTQTLYIFPLLILFWATTFPSALMVYWTTQNLFGIVQELILKKWKPSA